MPGPYKGSTVICWGNESDSSSIKVTLNRCVTLKYLLGFYFLFLGLAWTSRFVFFSWVKKEELLALVFFHRVVLVKDLSVVGGKLVSPKGSDSSGGSSNCAFMSNSTLILASYLERMRPLVWRWQPMEVKMDKDNLNGSTWKASQGPYILNTQWRTVTYYKDCERKDQLKHTVNVGHWAQWSRVAHKPAKRSCIWPWFCSWL